MALVTSGHLSLPPEEAIEFESTELAQLSGTIMTRIKTGDACLTIFGGSEQLNRLATALIEAARAAAEIEQTNAAS